MNILMLHPHDICSQVEPWAVRIVYIAKEFSRKGHHVKLVYFPLVWAGQKPLELEERITVIPFCRRLGAHILMYNMLKFCKLADWAEVIHFQKCFYHAALPAITAAMFKNKPLHYDWDDWEVKIYEVSTEPGVFRNCIRNFLDILENAIPKLADTVSVASLRLKLECEKLGIPGERIFDAHVGADIERFHPGISGESIRNKYGIDKELVLYLGQLHGGQYVELFIETASRVVNDYQRDVFFMIVGDGYRADELKGLAHKLNLDGKVIFTGAVNHDMVPEYIAAAHICVACFRENEVTVCKSPLKIVEYLASGKPIVASNVGDVPVMMGGAGILVPPGNVNALAEGILRFLDDGELRRISGELARKRAEEEYNWVVTAGNLLDAYKKAIALKMV